MPKAWEQMTAAEKLDELKTVLDDLTRRYNTAIMRLSHEMDDVKDRLSKLEGSRQ